MHRALSFAALGFVEDGDVQSGTPDNPVVTFEVIPGQGVSVTGEKRDACGRWCHWVRGWAAPVGEGSPARFEDTR
jgi:hypothetical protein